MTENVKKISDFLSDGRWHPYESIVRGTGLSDAELVQGMKVFFELEEADVIRSKDRSLAVYRLPPKQLDMFGNEVI